MENVKFFIPRDPVTCRCEYEEWDKAAKSICCCGKPAAVLTKKGAQFVGLCKEHAAFFLIERSECYKDKAKPGARKADYVQCDHKEVVKLLE